MSYSTSTEAIKYDTYIVAEILEQIRMERYTNELILLSESATANSIQMLQEAEESKSKGILTKLMEAIARLWASFVEKVNGLVKNDRGYLERYKEIILKRKIKEEFYYMYPFWEGTNRMLSSPVPMFNFNALKADLVDEETFITKHFNAFKPSGDASFIDNAKTIFRGADKEEKVDSARINMTTLYNYCMDYENLAKKLSRDQAEIKRAADNAVIQITKLKESGYLATNNQRYVYSEAFSSILLEAPVPASKMDGENNKAADQATDKNAEDKTGQQSNTTTAPSKAVNNIKKTEEDPNAAKEKESLDASAATAKDDIKKCELYIRVCYEFLGAKMSVAEETYHAYMFIIKNHVKSYGGSDKVEADTNKTEKQDGQEYGDKEEIKKAAAKMNVPVGSKTGVIYDKIKKKVQSVSGLGKQAKDSAKKPSGPKPKTAADIEREKEVKKYYDELDKKNK